ncbi:MAG: hypothetical protein RBS78_00975 [Coriobacteriia bacterium]|jgi:hypothetical protein|nr:hypothetical protein [Coriobacteriia bacterium]
MARAAQDKAYRTFVNGFITEATGLTFPENSARDIDNCDIELKGTVRRRLGLNEEANGYPMALGSIVDQTPGGAAGPFSTTPGPFESCTKEQLAITVHTWPHPGGDTNLNFVLIQVGNRIYIRNWDAEPISDVSQIQPLIAGTTYFDIDGSGNGIVYNCSHLQAAKTPMQSAVGYQRIWFTSAAVLPFYVEYNAQTKVVEVRCVGYDASDPNTTFGRLAIRDFNGIPDGLATDEQPTSLSDEHKYNLINQGWNATRWNAYQTSQSKYPSNAQQWILGKDSSDDFDPDLLAKQDFGNSLAPKGRIVINALTGDKDGYSGSPSDPSETLDFNDAYDEPAVSAFRTTAFYGGRVWFAGDNNPKRPSGVYFSKTLSKVQDAGTLMQENDPASEHFPDLLDTDGGVIYLTEAANIQKLLPFGAGLLVMASNGIWFIYGGDSGFTATTFSVEKVSSTGILSASSVVDTEQQVVFFAENSIHVLALPDSGVIPVVTDIGQTKIFTYYGRINREARRHANGCFDKISKKVFWSWLEADAYNYPAHQSCFNRMLVLDTRTGAFSKYSFTPDAGENYFWNGPAFPKRTITRPLTLEAVFDSTGEAVVDSGDNIVSMFVDAETTQDFLNSVKVLAIGSQYNGLRIMEFYDTTFHDYSTMLTVDPQDYVSYLVTGDEILGDLQRNKQATFLHSFFQRTETGFTGSNVGLTAKNPSGCTVVARWDWHNTGSGGRWSDPQAAYRYRRPYAPTGLADTFDTGEEIVYTKLKMRGKGRALTLRYESVTRKDFQLLGFSVSFSANGV